MERHEVERSGSSGSLTPEVSGLISALQKLVMEEVCAMNGATLLMLFLERGQGKTPVASRDVDGEA